ncbi:glycosyltransferase [Paucihalobacter ruber]|uniref:Glycosyltransferase n=1 Tax=Paucihalobacter ruber TaxID=2567861 RepID=A0A506PPC9_9FLAO|nr:glycosyltransferase [Paucihalobacter ruber]TPV35736.1 glycosyltransferase [Paucihalobacter ruber]
MRPQKVLIVIDWFLPGTASGGPLRSYANLIAQLHDGFEFYIITRDTDFGTTEPYATVVSNSWNQLNNHTQVYYLSSDNISPKHLKTLISETPFDVALVNGIYSWYFSILPVWLLKRTGKPVVVSARGMLNPQAFSVKGFRKKVFLTLARVLQLYKGVTFHATNGDEAQYIKQVLGADTPIKIAPNLPRPIQPYQPKTKVSAAPVKMANMARIAKEKGTLIMLQALQQVQQPLLLDLYGPIYDSAYWQQCEAVIQQLPAHIKVQYQGVLPGDAVPAVLQDYHFMVLLSEGENFGHAIFEAFAAGCPVIISDQTPWRQLEQQQIGWDVPIRDTAAVVRAFEVALLMSAADYEIWSAKAYNFAKGVAEDTSVLVANRGLFEAL